MPQYSVVAMARVTMKISRIFVCSSICSVETCRVLSGSSIVKRSTFFFTFAAMRSSFVGTL